MSTSGKIPVDGMPIKGKDEGKKFFFQNSLTDSSAETRRDFSATNIVKAPSGKKNPAEESTEPKREPKRIVGFDGYKQDTGVKPDDKSPITGAIQAQMAREIRSGNKPNDPADGTPM